MIRHRSVIRIRLLMIQRLTHGLAPCKCPEKAESSGLVTATFPLLCPQSRDSRKHFKLASLTPAFICNVKCSPSANVWILKEPNGFSLMTRICLRRFGKKAATSGRKRLVDLDKSIGLAKGSMRFASVGFERPLSAFVNYETQL